MPGNLHIIHWVQHALDDLAEMALFISGFNPIAARVLVQQIEDSVNSLADFPLRYRAGRVAGTREMPVGNYVVVYTVDENEVLVLRILHSARQWP